MLVAVDGAAICIGSGHQFGNRRATSRLSLSVFRKRDAEHIKAQAKAASDTAVYIANVSSNAGIIETANINRNRVHGVSSVLME
ncbi:hypothetical protein ASE95_13770 [Sphingomonas sp. Leaf231]|nr:hypothetical protein ASE95_13770 [Sphingomonas sp. Leaf231]